MSVSVNVLTARAQVEQLMDTTSDRWHHTVGVAGAAERAAHLVARDDAQLLVSAAWLHDIGYAESITLTGFHQLDGARFLRNAGFPARLCALVAHHSAAAVEADVRGFHGVLVREFPPEESVVADALTFADMTIGPTGVRVSVDERLAEILHRYPPGDPVHRAITIAAPAIRSAVARVRTLLDAQPR